LPPIYTVTRALCRCVPHLRSARFLWAKQLRGS
jgi:hypothetical protein